MFLERLTKHLRLQEVVETLFFFPLLYCWGMHLGYTGDIIFFFYLTGCSESILLRQIFDPHSVWKDKSGRLEKCDVCRDVETEKHGFVGEFSKAPESREREGEK